MQNRGWWLLALTCLNLWLDWFSLMTLKDVELNLTSLSSEFVKINALDWRIKETKVLFSPFPSFSNHFSELGSWDVDGWLKFKSLPRPAIIWKTVQECYSSTICIPHLHRLDAMDCLLVMSESCGSYLSVFSWHVEHTR